MREHIRVLGILNIIMGALGALIGLGVLLVMGGVAGIITAAPHTLNDSDFGNSFLAGPIVASIGIAVAVFFFALSLPAILGGWGLLNFKPWSRILMIIVSVFHLFHVPLGTALGVYGLWVLLNPESQRLIESGGALPLTYAPAPLSNAYPGPGRPPAAAPYPAGPNYPQPGPPA